MKGSYKTSRINHHLGKTNFNDWSDPKYKLPQKRENPILHDESSFLSEAKPNDLDDNSKSIPSNTTVDLGELRTKIRRGSPLMSKKEVREYRLPFYECLLLNLKDDGFFLTYEFIKELIAVDEAYHRGPGRDRMKKRPILKLTKSVLISLSEGLLKAERSRLNDEKTQEATAFLELATLYGDSKDPSWYWIAQEMFEQCMEVINNVENTIDRQLQATCKYLYGFFLFNELHDLNEAKSQIESSMAMSEGKCWKIGKTKENNLYMESCGLLHNIFLEMCQREMICENTEEAIQLCKNGLLWAKVVGDKLAEANALQKLMNIYLSVQQLFSVPEILESYMKLCSELENFEGLCEGYILSARYHDSLGEKINVIEDMKNLLKVAEENNITKMVAMAHHKLASYSLLKGSHKDLLDHSIEAYTSYLSLKKNIQEQEEAKCLVGVAQGKQIMSDYINLVVDSDNKNVEDQSTLIRWKNLRIPFFQQPIVMIPEIPTNVDLLNRARSKRAEENLTNAQKRQSILTSTTSKRTSTALFRSMSHSITLPDGMRLSTTSLGTKEKKYSENQLTSQPSISISGETKYRSISFLGDTPNKNLRSVSVFIESNETR